MSQAFTALLRALKRAPVSLKRAPLGDMIVSNLFHGKRHLVSHTQRGVSHTLQRIDALIKTLELQIFRVGIAGPDTRENACVRRSVLHREF